MIYTYLFHDVESGLTKIGKTENPLQRFRAIGSGRNLTMIRLLQGDCEKRLHTKYSARRRSGEWFELPKKCLDNHAALNTFTELPSKKTDDVVIKMTPEIHARVKAVSAANIGVTARSAYDVILEWALPQFESGKYKIKAVEITTK